jgi:predicted Zn-dependent protease
VPENDRCFYWISFIAISVLTLFIVPIIYYIIEALASLCTPPQRAASTVRESAPPLKTEAGVKLTTESGETVILTPNFERDPERKPLYHLLRQEIALTESVDKGPTNKAWLELESADLDQDFEHFAYFFRRLDNKPLYIQLIGQFSEKDKQIVQLTMDFLKSFHRIEVYLVNEILTMEQLKEESTIQISDKTRDWDGRSVTQYLANEALTALANVKERHATKECHYIAFTSEFLYSRQCANFVFGSGQMGGAGIFSNFLFGSAEKNFRLVTERMMKIAAHEFGHMRFIQHCGKHECNIGGYMSLAELDSRPFYYCSKDTAKLCLNTGVSMKQYYTDLLAYFQAFKQKQNSNFFDKEINHVQQKLNILKAHPEIYTQ